MEAPRFEASHPPRHGGTQRGGPGFGGAMLFVAGQHPPPPIGTPVFIRRKGQPLWLALGDEPCEGFQGSPHSVDERAVRRPRRLRHSVESAKNQARSVNKKPLRQGGLILAVAGRPFRMALF